MLKSSVHQNHLLELESSVQLTTQPKSTTTLKPPNQKMSTPSLSHTPPYELPESLTPDQILMKYASLVLEARRHASSGNKN